MNPIKLKEVLTIGMGIFIGLIIALLLTNSPTIALAFGSVSSIGPKIFLKRRDEARRKKLQKLWPEILDHIISGLNSGLSLSQTIAALEERGPELSRPIFKKFADEIRNGEGYSKSLQKIKISFSDSISDQVCEVLDFARTSGSRDSSLTLRTLATYIRSDLALRNEISAKHGWIRNAAILAGLAPWLLLTILSTQHSTVRAFSSPAGIAVLVVGVVLTLIAYFWMERVGRISTTPRIFIKNYTAVESF